MEAKDVRRGTVESSRKIRDGKIFIVKPTELEVHNKTSLRDCRAESDFFGLLTFNSLVVPGYGGRCHFPTNIGYLTLQVVPAEKTA